MKHFNKADPDSRGSQNDQCQSQRRSIDINNIINNKRNKSNKKSFVISSKLRYTGDIKTRCWIIFPNLKLRQMTFPILCDYHMHGTTSQKKSSILQIALKAIFIVFTLSRKLALTYKEQIIHYKCLFNIINNNILLNVL